MSRSRARKGILRKVTLRSGSRGRVGVNLEKNVGKGAFRHTDSLCKGPVIRGRRTHLMKWTKGEGQRGVIEGLTYLLSG